jgi:hypothetical protein
MQLSQELRSFLENSKIKNTLQNLLDTLESKSFGLILFLLMLPAALPLPTFGITHVLEIVVVLVSLQLILLRPTIWLPKKILTTEVAWMSDKKFVSGLAGFVAKIEQFSKPRLSFLVCSKVGKILTGVFSLILAVTSFFAPLATGLDTLPAVGAVLIAFGLVFEDGILWLLGVVVGIVGIVTVVAAYYFGLQIFGQLWQQVMRLINL